MNSKRAIFDIHIINFNAYGEIRVNRILLIRHGIRAIAVIYNRLYKRESRYGNCHRVTALRALHTGRSARGNDERNGGTWKEEKKEKKNEKLIMIMPKEKKDYKYKMKNGEKREKRT